MSGHLPPWAEPEADAAPAPRSRRAGVLVLALLPWLVVVGLVVSGRLPPGTQAPSTAPSTGPAEGADAARDPVNGPGTGPAPDASSTSDGPARGRAAPRSAEGPAGPGAPGADRVGGSGAAPAGPAPVSGVATGPVAAVAVAVARGWLTDVGPPLELDGLEPVTDLYLEHAVAERVERHGEHAVVTVLAILLERDGDVYARTAARRLAVPIVLGPPPRPAGGPWWVDEVELAVAPPEAVEPEEDEDTLLTLGEALVAAGRDHTGIRRAERTADGWWLVHTTAEEGGRSAVPIWVRPGPEGPVVAGAAASAAVGHDQE